jgi:hypothetical protein
VRGGRRANNDLLERSRLRCAEPASREIDALGVEAMVSREGAHRLTRALERRDHLARVLMSHESSGGGREENRTGTSASGGTSGPPRAIIATRSSTRPSWRFVHGRCAAERLLVLHNVATEPRRYGRHESGTSSPRKVTLASTPSAVLIASSVLLASSLASPKPHPAVGSASAATSRSLEGRMGPPGGAPRAVGEGTIRSNARR